VVANAAVVDSRVAVVAVVAENSVLLAALYILSCMAGYLSKPMQIRGEFQYIVGYWKREKI
jgi:hypothetical protein